MAEYYETVIIGAGLAGLGAATKLQESNKKNFKILEAQDEPGGRIRTISINGRPLDLGAQWLHGKENPLYNICLKNGLLSHERSEEGLGIFIRNDGVTIDPYLVKKVDFKIGQILEECAKFVDIIDCPNSVGEYLETEFLKYLDTCDDPLGVREMKLELLDWHVRFQVVDNSCCSLNHLSARCWGHYVCLDDTAHYNLKYGYKSLIDLLVAGLPENCIDYNANVTKIEHDENKVTVVCNKNRKIICDHLIVTVSLGVLKDLCKNIHPRLPKKTVRGIDNLGFYGIGKIYLQFESRWWGDIKGVQLLWRRNSVLTKEERWLKYLTGFDEVFAHPDILVGWVGSEGVEEMEKMEEEEVGEMCYNLLKRFLMDFVVPRPIRCIRTKWLSNPYVKGSYCHITPECDEDGRAIRDLAEPVIAGGVPRILLAGEAVHPHHYSTTHGAYESGMQQAALLCEYLSNNAK